MVNGKRGQLEKAGLKADRVLQELGRVAFSDIRGFFDGDNNLKPLNELTEPQSAALASRDFHSKSKADGVKSTVIRLRFWDKVRALETLAKHFGLLKDQVELAVTDDLIAILNAGREKSALLQIEREGDAPGDWPRSPA